MSAGERAKAKSFWRIEQFEDPDGEIERLGRAGVRLEEIMRRFKNRHIGSKRIKGNVLLNEGINELWTLVCGGAGTAFSNANAYIGVGDGTTAEDAAQTGLQGTSKLYKGMDAGYPTYGSDQKATWRATFGSAEANFAWEEITVANGSDDTAVNLNRKVQSMGTKASGTTWIATLEITLS